MKSFQDLVKEKEDLIGSMICINSSNSIPIATDCVISVNVETGKVIFNCFEHTITIEQLCSED